MDEINRAIYLECSWHLICSTFSITDESFGTSAWLSSVNRFSALFIFRSFSCVLRVMVPFES